VSAVDILSMRQSQAQWDAAATGWHAHGAQISHWLAPATDAMLVMAGIRPGHRVLDVAAGAGGQTLDIARRVGPAGSVLATDLSPVILSLAAQEARQAGLVNVQTQVADAQDLPLELAGFDAVVCRLGLMLCPQPLAALRGMHRALKPGGRMCTMVFSHAASNPCIGLLMATALEHAGLPPRDPATPGGLLSLGLPGLMDELWHTAGLREVATTRLNAPFRLPSAAAYLDFVRSAAGPVQEILKGLDDAARQAAWSDMATRLGVFNTATGWEGPNELLLTAGRR
jgi:SAM-dependent methyltransferase